MSQTPLSVLAVIVAVTLVLDARRRRRVTMAHGVGLLSCAALWVATGSLYATRSMAHLPDHMILHIVVMFLVPIGLLYAGAGRRWWFLVPVEPRRRLLRGWYRSTRLLRRSRDVQGLVGVIAVNAVMVSSHLPAVFNRAMASPALYHLVVEPAFLVSGCLFFAPLVASPPRRVRTRLRIQFAMVVLTMAEMLFLAMSMSIFTKATWYQMPSMGSMVMPVSFHDQQLAAAILWICGDVWAVPLLVVLVRRAMSRDGGVFGVLETYSRSGGSSSP